MNKALVSVIVPCYNVEKYAYNCLDSIVRQTVKDLQIIVVDDCSSDHTADIIRDFQQKDSRVIGIFHDHNQGVSVARNEGIENSQAQWLVFVDGDDFLPPDAIEKFLSVQQKTGADLVCCNAREYDEDGTPGRWVGIPNIVDEHLQLANNSDDFVKYQQIFCTCWGKLFRTSLIQQSDVRFNSSLRHAQDTLFTHSVILKLEPSVAIDFTHEVYCYRQCPLSCVHAIPVEKRLQNLETLIFGLQNLKEETGYSDKILLRKATEYLWAIHKFGGNKRLQLLQNLKNNSQLKDCIFNTILQYGKLKHRIIASLINHGLNSTIIFW